MKILIIVGCLFILSKNISHSSELVEIHLLDNLDDERGFCIDIKGHKSRASIDKGLQAHTCYSYQGQISIDQGFKKQSLTKEIENLKSQAFMTGIDESDFVTFNKDSCIINLDNSTNRSLNEY